MTQTLFTRLSDETQYDTINRIVLWRDTTESRWKNLYSRLNQYDQFIFILRGKILLGIFDENINNQILRVINVREFKIENDDFLRIRSLIPEKLSQLKANFNAFIAPMEINFNDLVFDIENKNYISFYIINSTEREKLAPNLHENDRVVIVDKNKIRWIHKFINTDYSNFEGLSNELFGAKDKSLVEIKKIHADSEKSYNLASIDRIIKGLNDHGSYKFNSFSEYYNIIHNKNIYKGMKEEDEEGRDESNQVGNTRSPDQNLILFGPPGTGKTYNTINKALEIIGEDLTKKNRKEIKDLFDTKMKEGQIVFTTFHQSMSYEDFIEGIKPLRPEESDTFVKYEVTDGIFKSLCKYAYLEYLKLNISENFNNNFYKFGYGWQALIDYCYSYLSSDIKSTKLKTLTGKTFDIIAVTDRGNIVLKPNTEKDREYIVSYERTKKLFNAIPDLTKVVNIDKEFRSVIGGSNSSAYWSVLDFINNSLDGDYQKANIENINKDEVVFENEVIKKNKDKKVKPYILIIDEINRGNVSAIFGELIALIEEDKRLGMEESLEATLPYSKEKFGVPPNLYIIGTMNTADRSVEALDAALRRRFSFEEMAPNPSLIDTVGKQGVLDTIDLPLVLTTINKRIEKLLDKDHLIGHSYFMTVTNLSDLKIAFQNKIIPLLQEYFFGDNGKIGLVLGKDFFEPIENTSDNIFAAFDDYDGSEFSERVIYKLRNISKMEDIKFTEAIQTLLS